tara:strand:+ start:317 stop:1180 length:864 start_codon:yes stop_codon:yes gene_type:complete
MAVCNHFNVKKKINRDTFIENLKEVISKDDEIIVFYTGIWSFINFLDIPNKKIPFVLLNAIEEAVGRKKTLVFPSFTSESFIKTKKFDIILSQPKESGILSVQALKSKNYIRTNQPLHSYLIKGPKSEEVKKLSLKTSWGKGSILSWLSKNKSRICTIGIPLKIGCSYFHKFEELYKVPWRYFKIYEGDLYSNKKYLGKIIEKKYSGPLSVNFSYDYSPVVKEMKKNEVIKKSKNKLLNIQSCLVSDIDAVCNKFFKKNPWRIIKNKKTIEQWIKHSKTIEINSQKK